MIDAYVITLNEPKYLAMADRVIESCNQHGLNAYKWEAFDGLKHPNRLTIPQSLFNQTHVSLLKVNNFNLTSAEVGNFYSHYTLWCHCVCIDKPIIILEHDVRFIKSYTEHIYRNCIVYLGAYDDKEIMPAAYLNNYDYPVIRGTHAYSIDPYVARNLISHVIKEGVCRNIDVTIRSDHFAVIQDDVYAVNVGVESTMPQDKPTFKDP